ncbi:MAG: amidohydrolase [Saprospiraceae bacterium]|nr:amidohydrolase [Saprospiraceae bacterium]
MRYLLFPIFLVLFSCQKETKLDLVIQTNAIYTATHSSKAFNAIGLIGDQIKVLDNYQNLKKQIGPETKMIDARDMFVMPGFIEGHGHFYGMGSSLQNLNFLKDTSWADIRQKVIDKAKQSEKGDFIFGRGWHQEKWFTQPENAVDAYPHHQGLSDATPDNPVILIHASGHSLFANKKAMDMAGITTETPDPAGGRIVRNNAGESIGVFEERAKKPIIDLYSEYLNTLDEKAQKALWYEAVELAQKECLSNGVTSFQDAGSSFQDLENYEKLALEGKLDIRLWAMLRHSSEEMEGKIADYKKINVGNNHFTCRAIKTELDGALGAYGAWLTEPYTDKPGFTGQNTTTVEEVATIAKQAFENGMQLCVHAIGDRANKETLDIIEEYNNKSPGLRWRIEHAQHLNPNDINRFKSTGAIASMQAVHCTSDAPFVVKRLGTMRAKIGAYAWKKLLENDVVVVNGTDVPVEEISPIDNFYASVTRTRKDNGMTFFVEQRMSREEALKSYTIDAAYGAFEEKIKGSIEVGKLADFTILDTNLLTCTDEEILDAKVMYTIVGGKLKYER